MATYVVEVIENVNGNRFSYFRYFNSDRDFSNNSFVSMCDDMDEWECKVHTNASYDDMLENMKSEY